MRGRRPSTVQPGTRVPAASGSAVAAGPLLLGTATTALVVLGSLTPFRFDESASVAGGWSCVGRIGWLPFSGEDLLVNLVVYLPVGFTFFGWVRRLVPFAAAVPAIATVLAAGLSLVIESAQSLSSVRCASWVDVMINTYGAFLGAALGPAIARAADLAVDYLRRTLEDRPLSLVALLMTVGLIIHGLAPFDFVTSADHFRASLLGSQWWPVAERYAARLSAGLPDSHAPPLSSIGAAGAFLLLGALQALANRRRMWRSRPALLGAIGHSVLVAVLIETLQLFVRSRVFDTADLAVNAVAAALGAWFAVAVFDRLAAYDEPGSDRVSVSSFVLGAVVLFQVVYALVSAMMPLGLYVFRFDASCVSWAPFAACFHMPFTQALGRMTSDLLVHALLVASLAAYQWERWGEIRWGRVAAIVLAVSSVCELVQCWSPARVADLTAPVIALVAVLGCAVMYRWVCRPTPETATARSWW
ncbi:MAG: VanZ family protein [Phycisphaerales bacterium]|nr:MAG: VanZ family protein [Phycisphaerales bacterium]